MKNFTYAQLKKCFSRWHDFDPSKQEPNPDRAWAVLVSIFAIILVAAFAWHYFAYLNLVRESPEPEEAVTTNHLDTRLLKQTVAAYQARVANFESLKQQDLSIPDPGK